MPTRTAVAHKRNSHPSSQFTGVIDGAEALVDATADFGEEKVVNLRKTLKADLELARTQLERLEATLSERANVVDAYVHENPWQAIGVAAAAGVIVGALAFRR